MRLKLILAMGLSLASCATSYQSQGFSGGFTETQLSENVFRVSFKGNGYTSSERAEDMAMLRSAELTQKSGYKYFGLAESRSSVAHSSYTTPTYSNTTAQATSFGNTAYGTAQTTSYGGDTIPISKPTSSNLVIMFHDKPDISAPIYDADFICASIGGKYKVTCNPPPPAAK